MDKLLLPGFGAPARLYRRLLVPGWTVLEPPSFRSAGAGLRSYRAWLEEELRRRGDPVWLAGHSMGGALAVLAAADDPGRIAGLTLISPAGLPLRKPVAASAADLVRQVAGGRYRAGDAAWALAQVLAAPRAAFALAREVRALDLSAEMERIRRSGLPVEVVSCSTDTLVTPSQCRRQAALLGARHRQLLLPGGHMWMLGRAEQLAAVLQ